MRRRLGVPDSKILLVLVGRLEAYKGVDFLFAASKIMPDKFAIRIAGACSGSYLSELESLADDARKFGADIDLFPRVLADQEFAGYLRCADYFIYPCRDINNSGSLNAALTANLPVIVPDRPELSWIYSNCKVVMRDSDEFGFDFEECFSRIQNISDSTYQQLILGAQRWVSERSWTKVSQQYIALYREALNG
jgi:glycosyltransferase involved in cell wall biosynthesis